MSVQNAEPAVQDKPVIRDRQELAEAFAAWFVAAPPEQTGTVVQAMIERLRVLQEQGQ